MEEKIRSELSNYNSWYHNIDLGYGIYTIDKDTSPARGHNYASILNAIPSKLSGKKVLDIGCNEGVFSLIAEKRGGLVTGIDYSEKFIEKAKWVGGILNSKVDYKIFDVNNVHQLGEFDVVLFIGVLYHLTDFFNVFEKIGKICKDILVFETASLPDSIIKTDLPVVLMGNGGRPSENKHMNGLVGHTHPNLAGCIRLGLEYGKFKKYKLHFTGGRTLIVFYK